MLPRSFLGQNMSSLYCCKDWLSSFSPAHPSSSQPNQALSDSIPSASQTLPRSPSCEQHPPRRSPPSEGPTDQKPPEKVVSHYQVYLTSCRLYPSRANI